MQAPAHPIKLLALDIDGTLLDPHKHITSRTHTAIRSAQKAGVIITLATARRYRNTRPIASTLGIDIPLILCDGALIIEHPQGQVLHTYLLQADIAQQAVDIMVRHHVQPIIHHIFAAIEETWTGPEHLDTTWLKPYLNAFPQHLKRLPLNTLCAEQPDPLRVVAFASEEKIDEMLPEITALPCTWDAIKRGNYGCAELVVMHQRCTKAHGVQALASLLHIGLEQVMAIGDNTNDCAMLQAAGWGVAMGQATEEVKAYAHTTTASNAEDGVALAIERYILQTATIP
jgi:Cof subfamily protein (haloacid dehalogenase superfamily)